MAQKVQVILIDDFDGGDATETVRFSLDRGTYEIDLSTKNADSLRETMAPWIAKARRVAADKPTRRSKSSGSSAARKETAEIREWAKKNGHNIGDRGRIPTEIVEEFRAAKR